MSIAKFDLYNAEWLDLVFDHRNKEYGAYDLRKNYGRTMSKAIGLSFIAVAALIVASFVFRAKQQEVVKMVPVTLDIKKILPPVEAKLKKSDPPKSVDPPAPAVPVKTTAIPTTVRPDNDPRTVDPPAIDKIEGAIGPANIDGPAKGSDNVLDQGKGPGGGSGEGTAPTNNNIVDVGGLEVMPEPVGGAAAWAKFLQKNLRFPGVAQDAGVSGRVIMSFVIEKDGSLSNIKVERGAGYGFDEEALRVLKLAKAWKPGIQNNQPVRVRYTIPINFQLSEQ
ncbi:energy transducer TonB [Mucilaginibacter lappiensis]|uniref:Protein TonB n=1 Tax=Mucilaginibacter lappiensis TaxID=354630 RepID=A0A841JC29_9SPHI|nr:energy transducer TonB [Mucilaginibacter lappiensis]MBB6109264.1 protein TonB [Mucilaginibacter lappiensis]MBB6127136.1 protein TonB [Mucilaginibacter lappiensis]